jgi:superfamily II DNA/RNA helicase
METWVRMLSLEEAFPGRFTAASTYEEKLAFVESRMDIPPDWRFKEGDLKEPGPTAIQCRVLPRIMKRAGRAADGSSNAGRGWSEGECNIVAQGEGGSGKTGAYLTAALLRLDHAVKQPQVVILAHTNALVNGIMRSAHALLPERFKGLVSVQSGSEVMALGVGVSTQAQVVVCLAEQLATLTAGGGARRGPGKTNWSRLATVVLDEADLLLEGNSRPITDFISLQCPAAQLLLFSATFASLQPHFPHWTEDTEWTCGGADWVGQPRDRPYTGALCAQANGKDAEACTACGFPYHGVPPGPLYGCASTRHSTNGKTYCSLFKETDKVRLQRAALQQLLSLDFSHNHAAHTFGSTIMEPVFTQPFQLVKGVMPRKGFCLRSPSGVPLRVRHLKADFSGVVSQSSSSFSSKVHFLAGLLAHFKLAHGVQLKTLVMCQTNPVGERIVHALNQVFKNPDLGQTERKVLWGTRECRDLETHSTAEWASARLVPSRSKDPQVRADNRRQQKENIDAFSVLVEGEGPVLVGTFGTTARGLDIKGLDLVVLWDLPEDNGELDLESCKHAIKRVGRVGQGHSTGVTNQAVLYMVGDNCDPTMPPRDGASYIDLANRQGLVFNLFTSMERIKCRGSEADAAKAFYAATKANLREDDVAPYAAELHKALTESYEEEEAYEGHDAEGRQGDGVEIGRAHV